ncbi:MAG: hypothetical protein AAB390_01505 [Patescibacteria group bacterium]
MAYSISMAVLIILYVLVFVYFWYTLYAMFKAAPFVPLSKENVQGLLALARLRPEDVLMDLGSGDGRILASASPAVARAIGIEINPILYWWSKFRWRHLANVKIVREDLWKTDLSGVDVLTLYFIPPKMSRLAQKIKAEMKPGSRVLSYAFKFPDWQYAEKDGKMHLYLV